MATAFHSTTMRGSLCALIGLAALALVGCNKRPGRIAPPDYDPESFAASIVARCDSDGDGVLSGDELSANAPGVAASIKRYDSNGDGRVASDELAARAAAWRELGIGMAPMRGVVLLGDRQLGGATVRLIPDESLADVLRAAEMVTEAEGPAFFQIPAELRTDSEQQANGMQFGLYRIEATHPDMKLRPADGSRGRDFGREDIDSNIVIRVERE